jgi:hypothetical protein
VHIGVRISMDNALHYHKITIRTRRNDGFLFHLFNSFDFFTF